MRRRLSIIAFLLISIHVFNSCKSVDQSIPQIKFEVEAGDTTIILDNKHPDGKIDISGEPIHWTATAYDLNRVQTIGFYYKNLRIEFPDGIEGVDTVNHFFTIGGQKVGQLTINFDEYHPERSISGVAYHDVDSRAILRTGSFYHIKAVDLDAPVNHVSPSLSLSID